MKQGIHRKRTRHHAWRVLFIIAAVAALTTCAFLFKPQVAETQVDQDNVVFLTKRNMGNISLKNETIWFRCEENRKYCGYQKWKIENKAGKIRFGVFIKYDVKSGDQYEHKTTQIEVIMQPGSLVPISEEFKFVKKANHAYFRNEKVVDYDWRGNSITVTRGDENKKQSRKIMIKEDAVDQRAVLFYLLEKEKLGPGNTYRFYSFLSEFENITLLDFNITREIEKDLYEVNIYSPSSLGTGGVRRFWVSPRSEKNPNGEIVRIEAGSLIYTKTTEAKATNKPPAKKKKGKK